MKSEIVIGTRESELAMWQTNWVIGELKKYHPEYEYKVDKMKTKGDKILDIALAKIGDKGLFTKELETSMLERKIDFAVHSMKDLPTILPTGLKIGAVCKRENCADVLLSRNNINLADLPRGARLGTSSLRRCAQLLAYRPDLQLVSLRGNLNTRLKKMELEKLDGIVLAAAGVIRMGWKEYITEYIPFEICLPAVGQGSVGIEIRDNDEEVSKLLESINDRESETAIIAERALLRKLEGGCQVPIGALGKVEGNKLTLEAAVVSLDGKQTVRQAVNGSCEEAAKLGTCLANTLLDMGGKEILEQVRKENGEEI